MPSVAIEHSQTTMHAAGELGKVFLSFCVGPPSHSPSETASHPRPGLRDAHFLLTSRQCACRHAIGVTLASRAHRLPQRRGCCHIKLFLPSASASGRPPSHWRPSPPSPTPPTPSHRSHGSPGRPGSSPRHAGRGRPARRPRRRPDGDTRPRPVAAAPPTRHPGLRGLFAPFTGQLCRRRPARPAPDRAGGGEHVRRKE